MATGRCQSCNADLPRGARFCARCGVGVAEIPVLDLTEGTVPDAAVAGDDVPPSRTRIARTLVVLVLVGVVVMLVLSALADGDDGADGDTDESASTTSTTLGGASIPPSSAAAIADDAVLADAFGLVLMLADEGQLTVFDPATGARHVEPSPFGAVPQFAAADEDLVALEPDDDELQVLGADARWTPLAGVPGWRPVSVDANGVVQLSGLDAGGFWSQAALGIVSDGESLHLYDRELSLLQGWVAVGEIDGDLVVSTVDGVFRFGPDGSAQRVASGRPLALSEAILVVLSCDDAMRCGPSSVDLRTGVTSRLPELSGPVVAASVSPDGSRIILGAAATPSEVEAFVLLGDSWVPLVSDGAWHVGTAVWGDGGAMWWDPDRHRLVAVTLQGDQVGTEVLPLGVDVHSAVVVPRADLPQLWRDALDAAS